MLQKIFEITLDEFCFPNALSGKEANFRFLIDLRFIDAKGDPRVLHSVLPSVADFWECDENNSSKRNYVRANSTNGTSPSKFDMNKVDDWDKTIFWVRGESLKAIRFRVYDVNRKKWWNNLSDLLKSIPNAFETLLGPALGVAEEALSTLIEMISSDSNLLFQRSQDLGQKGSINLTGPGIKGKYTIKVTMQSSRQIKL